MTRSSWASGLTHRAAGSAPHVSGHVSGQVSGQVPGRLRQRLRLRPGSVARAEDLLHACVRECADRLAAVRGTLNAESTRLVAAIGALVAEHSAHEPSRDRCFEALLRVSRAGLEAAEPVLARRVADTAVALRSRSAGAWRLRGEALSALGRDGEAVDAFERARRLPEGER